MRESRQINLSSQSATRYLNNSYLSYVEYSFPNFIRFNDNVSSISCSVQNASLPVSYYTIDHRNMNLEYSFDNVNKTIVSFNHGNYNANTFKDEFERVTPFKVIFNKSTGIYNFTHPTSNFYFHKENSTCFKILGFNKDLSYQSTFNILFAPYLADLSGIRIIKIRSNTIVTNNADSNTGTYSGDLCSIPITVGSYGIINYVNANNFSSVIRNKSLSLFDIQILDEYDELINFNNINWSITLQFDIEYSNEVVEKEIKEDNKKVIEKEKDKELQFLES